MAFSLPYVEAPEFLAAIQEIPPPEDATESHGTDKEDNQEEKKWIMKAVKSAGSPGGLRNWARESWTTFVDLLKVCFIHVSNNKDIV